MSGWERPTPPTPDGEPARSYWAEAPDPDRLGPRQLIGRAWRLYRSTPRRFLVVAAIPGVVRDLLALPGLVIAGLAVQGVFEVLAGYLERVAADPEAYRYADSQAVQAELQARFQAVVVPQPDLAALSAVGGGAGVAIALIGTAVLSAAALAAAAGHPISVGGAFRMVAARSDGLVRPIIALGAGWVAVSSGLVLLEASSDLQAWVGAPASPRSVLIGSLLSVLAIVLTIGILVTAVRWALFIPAVLAEDLGLGRGLARAARLTRGIRGRLALAMAALLILQAVTVGLVAAVVGIVVGIAVGLSAGSAAVGIGAYLAATLIGNLLWAPLLPAMLALAYLEQTGDTATSASSARSAG